jgi:hypothetical protein
MRMPGFKKKNGQMLIKKTIKINAEALGTGG